MKWAIRDISHGKTFHFSSWEEMVAWILRAETHVIAVPSIETKDYKVLN